MASLEIRALQGLLDILAPEIVLISGGVKQGLRR